MNKNLKRFVAVALTLAVVAVSGCGKRNVTVSPEDPPPPPPPQAAETPPPAPPPPPTPMFVEEGPPSVDVDAVIREAFETIYFDYDQFTLKEASVAALGRAGAAMREHPGIKVMAEGHADERGTSAYNVGLGENRAKAVREYLVTYGIEGSRIDVTSFGKERPANPNCGADDSRYESDECHAKNRRVEWRITAK